MDYHRNPELIERLAAEYVLGTLRGPARLRLARLMREDATVAHAVRGWEARLTPMASALREVRPHRRVWSAIEARLRRADWSRRAARPHCSSQSRCASPA